MKDINHCGYCVYGWWVSIELLLTMGEVCDTPITNYGGTNSPTRNRHYSLMKTCSVRSKRRDQYHSDNRETNYKTKPFNILIISSF